MISISRKVKKLKLKEMEENNDRERKQLEIDIEQRKKKLEEKKETKPPTFQIEEKRKIRVKQNIEHDLIGLGDPKYASLEFEVSSLTR